MTPDTIASMKFARIGEPEWPQSISLIDENGREVGVVTVTHLGNDTACGYRLQRLVAGALRRGLGQ